MYTSLFLPGTVTDFIILPERGREGGREGEGEGVGSVDVPALSPMESGMKREGSEVFERKEARRWLDLMGGSCSRAWR